MYPRRRYGYGGPTPAFAPPPPRHHHHHHIHHHPPPPPPPPPRHRLHRYHPPTVIISSSPPPPPPPAPAPAPAPAPVASISPSAFPPGTDPDIVACFNIADQDGSGLIDDNDLQRALSDYNQGFSLRTVRLLMHLFNNSNTRKIGPKEFTELYYSLQYWRSIFERFDRDKSGKIDASELREALLSLGYSIPPPVLELLVAKFDKSGGKDKSIEYDNFIECCLTVKGLTEKFKEKDTAYTGSATFTYESFMLDVLPIITA